MIGSTALILGALITSVAGHGFIESPCVRGSTVASCKYPNPDTGYITAPIGAAGEEKFPLCHYTEAYAEPVATFKAGSSVSVKFSSTAAGHNGGHCQFSLSYDNGKTFIAIHTIMGDCDVVGTTMSVPIPSDAPSAAMAIFAWTWVNKSGNREFYMNCADVKIDGKAGGKLSGPEIVIANYPGGVTIGEFLSGTNDGSEYYPGGSSSSSKTTAASDYEEAESAPAKSTTTKSSSVTKSTSTSADDSDASATTADEPTAATDDSTTTKTSSSTKSSATSTSDDESSATTTEESTKTKSPSSKATNSARSSTETSGPACKSAGTSPDIIVMLRGQEIVTSCSGGQVCNNTNGVGAFCDTPKADTA